LRSTPSPSYKAIEKQLGIRFKKRSLIKCALIHSSYMQTRDEKINSNETLEFLGDAVLELIVREFLRAKYPDASEGTLSESKKKYTSTSALHSTGKRLCLGKFLIMSKGEERTGGRNRPSIIAGCLEAIIGALYLDRGLDYTTKFVKNILLNRRIKQHKDHKSILNRWALKNQQQVSYRVVKETGIPHNKKFYISLYIDNKKVSRGTGTTKKKAEQEAAKVFLKKNIKYKTSKPN
jgi:ribonuclease-3